MPPPQAFELNLLGVRKSFTLHLQDAQAVKAFQPTALFSTCVVTREDLQLCEPQEKTALVVRAWQDLDADRSVAALKSTKERGIESLNLLLCNTATPQSTLSVANPSQDPPPAIAVQWRTRLSQELNVPFEVIYGQGSQLTERIRFAWSAALKKWGLKVQEEHIRTLAPLRFQAFCEKCSDPQCERHLFGLGRL
jgi:hypothetical protein